MVKVNVLENDRFGSPTGTIAGLEIDDYLNLKSIDWCDKEWSTKFYFENTYGGGRVVLFEQIYFKVYRAIRWSGSKYWNSYIMPYGYAISLINCLLRSKKFVCEEAEMGIFEKISRGEELTGADFDWEGIESIEPLIYNENQLQLPL